MTDKKKILLFADWFEPGFRAGGPIRSCVNFVRYMQNDYLVDVFTSDRDLGSSKPYDDIATDRWISGNHTNVRLYYCSPARLTWKTIREQLLNTRPDFIYLNSMFSLPFTIYPLLLCRLHKLEAQIVLSPRGMLRASALQYKPLKKKLFLKLFNLLGLYRRLSFHASDSIERQDVGLNFGPGAWVTEIPNFPAAPAGNFKTMEKRVGEASLISIGRIHPIKNLDYLLEVLLQVRSSVTLTIVGSIEDKPFWEKCRNIIGSLPENVVVRYAGEIPNHELPALAEKHHIFALPTRGENFGHAIFESLAIGRPVLISDQTPWKNLTISKVGWDLPLDKPELFRQSIEQIAGFGQEEYDAWSLSAYKYIENFTSRLTLREDYLKLFSKATGN